MSLERADAPKRDALHAPFSPKLHAVLAWTDPQEQQITWLSEGTRGRWGVGIGEIHHQASRNLDALLQRSEFHVEHVGGTQLGLIETESPFKASLLLAPSLKDVVAAQMGWPIWAIAPCRDFLFLLRDGDEEAIDAVAQVVLHEYDASEQRLSTEVLRVSDEGWGAIGEIR